MKRWQVTYLGKPFLLYGDTAEEVKRKYSSFMDEGSDILPYQDNEYQHRINYITQGECVNKILKPNGFEQREVYRHDCFLGKMFVRISKDIRDGEYYDFCQYQIIKPYALIKPITWTCALPKEVYDLLHVGDMQYQVYSSRLYGQPKLDKPKELKNVKSIGSAEFIPKKCNPMVYVKDNDVWIKHTDYFSSSWKPPKGERVDMPMSYYVKKYFNKNKREKFVYADGWGDIVLRNEAWLVIKNLIPLIEYPEIDNVQIRKMIVDSQEKVERCTLSTEWRSFWENVIRLVKERSEIK